MSFGNIEQILREVEEKLKRWQTARTSGIQLGELKEVLIIDAIPQSRELHMACIVDGKEKVLVCRMGEQTDKIVSLLEDGKCVYCRCRIFGNRITEIVEVQEYTGKLEPNKVGVLRRSRSGSRFWIDTTDGQSYLISDFSIKGMKLNGEANDGDIVIMLTFEPEPTRAGVYVIKFMHYQIIRRPREEEEEKKHEDTTIEEEEAGIDEKIEEIARQEVENELSEARNNTGNEEHVSASIIKKMTSVNAIRKIASQVLGPFGESITKNEKNVKLCIENTESLRDAFHCMVDMSDLSRVMKDMAHRKVDELIGKLELELEKMLNGKE